MTPQERQEVEQIATQIYQKLGSRFGVNQTPIHFHDEIGSPNIPPTSLTNTFTLSAASGGAINNLLPTNIQAPVVVFPVPVVTAHAPLGFAPDGTIMCQSNGIDFNAIYWRAGGRWRGVNVDHSGTVTGIT